MDSAKGSLREGGIADDGMDVDPVSGNEVPAGSLASEVRDDIPAQLSEGEYVVPADVLRYYGVRFFENLREEAKGDLSEMEANGRIGGEPVLAPDAATGDLTAEELAEIDAVMAMYGGGDVRQGYNIGGFTAPKSTFDPSRYRPGYSFTGGPTPVEPDQSEGPAAQSETVTLYGPSGQIATLILPADQARYEELLGQGYTTTETQLTTPSPTTGDGGSNDPDPDTDPDTDPDEDSTSDTTDFNFDIDDPLGAVNKALDSKNFIGKVGGAIIGTAINPVFGKAASSFGEGIQGYANLKTAAENLAVAKALGYDVTKEQARYDSRVKDLGLIPESLGIKDDLDSAGQLAIDRLFDPTATGGVDRTKFQSDEAFTNAMEEMAPPGMTYDPTLVSTQTNPDTGETTTTTGGYTTPDGTSSAPTTSIRPVGPPSTGGSSDGGSVADDSNAVVGSNTTGSNSLAQSTANLVTPNDGTSYVDGVLVNDPAPDTGGGGGGGDGCCFIMLEARYGDGTMDKVVRRYRDEYMTDTNRRGYYKTAEVLVPLMRKSKVFKWVVTKTFADPLVAYGKYYYGENRYGVIFAPVKNLWMKVFNTVGGDTKFIRENGETV